VRTLRLRRVSAALCGIALLGLAAVFVRPAWMRGGARPRNLLLVTIDTLRADRVGAYGHAGAQTPHLDALARAGLRFERATTVAPLTLPAHASLLTGTFPGWHGVRDNGGFYLGDEQTTLAEVLRERGFRTGGFVASFVLDRRWGTAQGFERFFDEFDLERFKDSLGMDAIQRPGNQVVDRAVAWLDEDRARPFFAWVHLYDPHAPYEAPEPYRSRFPPTQDGGYDAEIAFADAQLGRLLEALGGRRRDTLVVVAGDHGEMLGERSEQTHGYFLYEPVTRVPLVMAGPGWPARAVPDQVRVVDVVPTVLGRLAVPAPSAVQGTDLSPLARGERLSLLGHSESWYPRYHYGWSELRSVQDGRFKLIHAPRPELFDLQQDPREARDLAAEQPQRVATLTRALEDMERRLANAAAPTGPRALDAETEERLAALGYVAGGGSARHLEDRPRRDPKDTIGLYNLLKQASTQSALGHVDEGIAAVRRALAEDGEIVEGHVLLGNLLKKAQRPADAIAAYRRALALDDANQGALFALALQYKESGRLPEARAGFERARSLDPRNGKVLWQLADLLMREGRAADAEAVVKDALARKVDEHRFLLKLGEAQIEAGRFAEAERSLRDALAKKPGLEGARFNLGLALEGLGRRDEAIAAYREEVAGHQQAYRAAFNLARLLQDSGRQDEALSWFRKAVDASPTFGTGQLYLAKALLDRGDLAGAERWAKGGLANEPDARLAPLGHFVLADVYNRLGRAADAQREQRLGQKRAAGG
jgi:choline-sulfatase